MITIPRLAIQGNSWLNYFFYRGHQFVLVEEIFQKLSKSFELNSNQRKTLLFFQVDEFLFLLAAYWKLPKDKQLRLLMK